MASKTKQVMKPSNLQSENSSKPPDWNPQTLRRLGLCPTCWINVVSFQKTESSTAVYLGRNLSALSENTGCTGQGTNSSIFCISSAGEKQKPEIFTCDPKYKFGKIVQHNGALENGLKRNVFSALRLLCRLGDCGAGLVRWQIGANFDRPISTTVKRSIIIGSFCRNI